MTLAAPSRPSPFLDRCSGPLSGHGSRDDIDRVGEP